MFVRISTILCVGIGSLSAVARADFLPPNDLWQEDGLIRSSNMTEAEFNEIIDLAEGTIGKIALDNFGATLKVNRLWSDRTVNANANQRGNNWMVNMYGGLARRPEVTSDGFAMVLCHEIGHHLGGFPFSSNWAANEGQADYFAAQACPRLLWQDQSDVNASFRATIDPIPKALCDSTWESKDEQNLCYRVMMAGKSSADIAGALGGTKTQWGQSDTKQVKRTDNYHPAGQCRLDTYIAGALCTKNILENVIPGKDLGFGRNGQNAERLAAQYSCMQFEGFTSGYRPLCWFKPSVQAAEML